MKEERRCRLRLVADETCRVEADISKKHLRKLVFRDKPNPLLKGQLLHHFYSLQCFFCFFQKLENEICYLLLLYSLGSPKRVTPFFFNARCPSWCNPKLICSPSCNWTWDILWMHKQVNYGSNGWLDGCCVVLHRCQSVSRKASPADSIQHEYISWIWGAPHLAGQLASPASEFFIECFSAILLLPAFRAQTWMDAAAVDMWVKHITRTLVLLLRSSLSPV